MARSLVRSVFGEFVVFAVAFPGSAEQLLCLMLSRLYAEIVRNEKARGILRMLIAECGNFPEVVDAWHAEVVSPGLAAFRQVLRRASL